MKYIGSYSYYTKDTYYIALMKTFKDSYKDSADIKKYLF